MENGLQNGLQIPLDDFLGHAVGDRWHTPSELHSDPTSLWDLPRLSIRSTPCTASGSLS